MTKKKRFGISEALNRGFNETINVVENNAGTFRNVVLPLSRIELDPENPRKLAVDLADVRLGVRPDDARYEQKQDELERLRELAHTIQSSGVINPVVVYKFGETYRVVAGERRCLASLLAGKQEIDARVYNEKPKGFDLKLVQWIENTAREDLTLDERLGNVRDIIKEYINANGEVEVTATLLKSITGLSLSQTTYYLAVLNAPDDIKTQIQQGHIRNLDKAALLASISSVNIREAAITACKDGASLKVLRSMINQQKLLQKNVTTLKMPSRGRTAVKINLGATTNATVVKTIVDAVLSQKSYDTQAFKKIDWMDLRQASRAFRKLVELLEVEMTV